MLFTQSIFLFYFLPIAIALHRIIVRFQTPAESLWPRYWLIGVTLVFYGGKTPLWLVPLGASVLIDYLGGRKLFAVRGRASAKYWAVFFVGAQLALLALSKNETARAFLLPAGMKDPGHPPGISFYTLESISFLMDVYRGVIRERVNFSQALHFIAMFPRFIAGPIVRFSTIQGQTQSFRGCAIDAGLFVFIYGFFLKVALADSFALFTGYASIPATGATFAAVWLGVIAYGMQVYFDFSGYSLMAIGLGKCFGFQFPTNFDRPFHAVALHEYWNKWHMTLGSWLKDYIFHPMALALSRLSPHLIYAALFSSMVICGLWHGATVNFLLWGAWHGAFLCLERKFRWDIKLPRPAARLVTLLIVFFGIGIYKGADWTEIKNILCHMLSPGLGLGVSTAAFSTYPVAAGLAAYGLVHCVVVERWISAAQLENTQAISFRQAAFAAVLFVLSLTWVLSDNYVPFLYFQF